MLPSLLSPLRSQPWSPTQHWPEREEGLSQSLPVPARGAKWPVRPGNCIRCAGSGHLGWPQVWSTEVSSEPLQAGGDPCRQPICEQAGDSHRLFCLFTFSADSYFPPSLWAPLQVLAPGPMETIHSEAVRWKEGSAGLGLEGRLKTGFIASDSGSDPQ